MKESLEAERAKRAEAEALNRKLARKVKALTKGLARSRTLLEAERAKRVEAEALSDELTTSVSTLTSHVEAFTKAESVRRSKATKRKEASSPITLFRPIPRTATADSQRSDKLTRSPIQQPT